jgi:guanylate kinase
VIVIVSGPGGVGKGTVVGRLLELDPRIRLSRSWTTRSRRPDEPEDAYVFVDRDTFRGRVGESGFLEWTEFPGTGHLYGTPTLSDDDGIQLLEIELDGAQQVKSVYPDSVLILIVAPSRQAQEERLRRRGEDEASVGRRLDIGADEQELGARLADRVVVNDDVDRAAREVAGIIAKIPKDTEPHA